MTVPINTLAFEWASLEATMFPIDTLAIRREEMRQGFYAGAAAMLCLIFDGIEHNETGDLLALLCGWQDEIMRHAETLIQRDASA